MPRIDRSTEPDIIRSFRRHTGLTQQRLGELLGCTNDAVSGFERDGAPGWMRYALFGIAVKEIGMRADLAAALVGISPTGPLLDRVPPPRASARSPAADRPAAGGETRDRDDREPAD
jgi:hypothetical protein